MKSTIDNYVQHGCPPGGCCRAILANDLTGAFARADEFTTRDMSEIVGYIYRTVPHSARGSYETVDSWRGIGVESQ